MSWDRHEDVQLGTAPLAFSCPPLHWRIAPKRCSGLSPAAPFPLSSAPAQLISSLLDRNTKAFKAQTDSVQSYNVQFQNKGKILSLTKARSPRPAAWASCTLPTWSHEEWFCSFSHFSSPTRVMLLNPLRKQRGRVLETLSHLNWSCHKIVSHSPIWLITLFWGWVLCGPLDTPLPSCPGSSSHQAALCSRP